MIHSYLPSFFLFRELVNQHPDNLGTTLKHVIYNELSQQRNPNNMAILQVMFQIEPENAAKVNKCFFVDSVSYSLADAAVADLIMMF